MDVLKVLWPGQVLGNLGNVFCLLIPEDVELLEPAADDDCLDFLDVNS